MRRIVGLIAAGAGLVIVAAMVGYALKRAVSDMAQPDRADFAVMLAPPEVTLTMIGRPVETDGVSRLRPFQDGDAFVDGATVFSDRRGLPYYTSDKDTQPGRSTCSGDCLKVWSAAIAPTDAKPIGDWSVITRDDGSRQWAFENKPLYGFSKDEAPGDAKGDGAEDGAWHTVLFKPGAAQPRHRGIAFAAAVSGFMPFGLAIHEIEAAGGQVLTDDAGRTIYAFDGDPKQDRPDCAADAPCDASPWLPIAAPALASGTSDFTIVERADGTGQWAYKGWPLYRYAGDSAAGQSNGIGIDRRWKAAVLVRYPMPAPVTLRSTTTMGKIFATVDGRSLYRQQLYYYSAEAGNFEHGYPYQEIVGRLIGGRGCVGDCTRTWHPFVAAPEAQPSGHWSILMRSDGTRQWAYKGYALYTFADDKKPGDLLGLDIWDITPNDPALHNISLLSRLNIDAESVTGIFFTTAYP
jgi:predicted lipoprotein with Yx(FWY)xxD motif